MHEILPPELAVLLAEVGWPIVVFVIGALTMHRTGMLPQQRRLDVLLKDVIRGQEEQLRLRDETIQGLQQQINAQSSAALSREQDAHAQIEQRDAALDALHRALAREHNESEELRAQLADTTLKINALTSLRTSRKRDGATRSAEA